MPQHLRRALLVTAAFALFASGSVAAPIDDGQAAFDQGDYDTALKLWRPLAEQGVARAQNNLGVMYENGKGVPVNSTEALKWYRLAAEQGYAGAQNNLGLIYAIGRLVPRDPVRAYMWFSLAAAGLSGDVGKTVTTTRDVFAGSMTPQQIAEGVELARQCLASSYKQCERGREAVASDPSPPPTPAIATTSHDVTASDYPSDSVRLHESGSVTVTYVVNERGTVSDCTVVLTSGKGRLDEAACAMVKRRWRYTPAMQDGKPVTMQYVSTISFPPR